VVAGEEAIVAGTTEQDVMAAAATEDIVANAAHDVIAACPAANDVVARQRSRRRSAPRREGPPKSRVK